MLKIAGIQFSCTKDKLENNKKALTLSNMAVCEGAKIICFQELFNLPWFPNSTSKEVFSAAEEINGETISLFSDFAKTNSVVVICPIFEKGDKGLFYNTAVVIGSGGNILGKYRKVHIPSLPLWEEKYYFDAGDSFPVFDTEYAKIGIQICWDNFFPEGSRILALNGAEIIFAPTAAAFKSHDRWSKAICANSIFNNLFIFRINRVGEEERQYFYGKSFCTNPNGEILSEPAGLHDAVVLVNIDIDTVRSVRQEYGYLKNRKVELYYDIIRRI